VYRRDSPTERESPSTGTRDDRPRARRPGEDGVLSIARADFAHITFSQPADSNSLVPITRGRIEALRTPDALGAWTKFDVERGLPGVVDLDAEARLARVPRRQDEESRLRSPWPHADVTSRRGMDDDDRVGADDLDDRVRIGEPGIFDRNAHVQR